MRPADFLILLLADWRVCLETPGVALQTLAWEWPAFRGRRAISWGSSLLSSQSISIRQRSGPQQTPGLRWRGTLTSRGWTLGARGCRQVRKTRVCRGLCWALGVHIQKRRFFGFAFFFFKVCLWLLCTSICEDLFSLKKSSQDLTKPARQLNEPGGPGDRWQVVFFRWHGIRWPAVPSSPQQGTSESSQWVGRIFLKV